MRCVMGQGIWQIIIDIPDGRRSTGRHQYPTGRSRVPDKKHKYEDDDDAREEHNYA